MFDFITDPINDFIRDMLKGWIEDNLSQLFVGLNNNVAGVAMEVSQTPSTWNGGIFNVIRSLSETAIVPIGAIIITYVLCYLATTFYRKMNMPCYNGHSKEYMESIL